MRGRKRDTVIGPNHLGEAKLLEGALEDREGELLLGGQQGLARQQVATGEVGDREGIAVSAIAEKKFAFVVGTPEHIRLRGPRERCPARASSSPAPMEIGRASCRERVEGGGVTGTVQER